jgi:hypothetical protein
MGPRDLIKKAFEASGRPGHAATAMTIAVLKNRMLQLSDRVFDEKVLGFESFIEFLAAHADLVEVDRSTRPATVRLMGAPEPADAATAGPPSTRIRPDLWQAIMDYSSGTTYVWDAAAGVARPRGEGDSKASVLPTTTPSEIHEVRAQFEAHHRAASTEPERTRLANWAANDLSTDALPPRLRGPWNAAQKALVRSKLHDWFETRGLQEPGNVEQHVERPARRKSDELRDWVHAVVDAMTDDEFRALQLPANATLRARRG